MHEASSVDVAGRPKRVPDFFIVGHQKCGTTALYRTLKDHPQVFMPRLKEPRFLASDLRDRVKSPKETPRPGTMEEYLALFEPAEPEQRVGEASPIYLSSRTAAAQIAQLQPKARVIAILREPASFLRSLHLQFLENHVETERSFRKAIELEPQRRQGNRIPLHSPRPQVLLYSDHVRYAEQLRRYHAVLPPEQVLVLIYDEYRRDNAATLRTVLGFLGLDDMPAGTVTEANPTVRVRGQRLYKAIHAVSASQHPASRVLRGAITAVTPRAVRGPSAIAIRDRLFYTAPSEPDEKFMLELRRRFKPEVQAASDYLDRDLVTLWGYDKLD